MSASGDSTGFEHGGDDVFAARSHACPACGARARRAGARYCSTCGRSLEEEYFPTDALRASYRFERVPTPANKSGAVGGLRRKRRRRRAARSSWVGGEMMLPGNVNGVTATARAFAIYALVPYLGILFCPGALLLGVFGLLRPRRARHAGARRDSALGLALGLLILCAQLLLWWVLYKVPEWSRQSPF